jgi:hypothetical protein
MVENGVMTWVHWLPKFLRPVSDEGYVRRSRKQLERIERWRPWLIGGYVLLLATCAGSGFAFHFALDFFVFGGNANPGFEVLAYSIAFLIGLAPGLSGMGFAHFTAAYCSLLRHWRLVVGYHDALDWLATQSDDPRISREAGKVIANTLPCETAEGSVMTRKRWLPKFLRPIPNEEYVRRARKSLDGFERSRRWFIPAWVLLWAGWTTCAIFFVQFAIRFSGPPANVPPGIVLPEANLGLVILAYVLGFVCGAAACGFAVGIADQLATVIVSDRHLRPLIRYHDALERLANQSEEPATRHHTPAPLNTEHDSHELGPAGDAES